jgi:chemotaxis protein MotB
MKLQDLEDISDSSHVNPFYISFSDLMVLLCVFFVLILGMSKIEIGSFEKMKTGFTGDTKGTLVELHNKLLSIIEPDSGINVELARDGVRIDLDTTILFDTGSSVLKTESLATLIPILAVIRKTSYRMDIEGHTDDVPLYKLHGDERESNWSLSGRRSASMVHHLQDSGFPDERMRIVGYGSTHPKKSPAGIEGEELDQVRAKNRRVSILIR